MRRVLVFGAGGQVGTALQHTVPDGTMVIAHGSAQTDVGDAGSVARALHDASPDAVINCAAFTRVDDAEGAMTEAMRVNGHAPGIIARACHALDIPLLHLSTDYVFDGERASPYPPDAATNPVNAYGITKREGEAQALRAHPQGTTVVRTAWVHGGGTSFVRTATRILGRGERMRVIDDQVGTPTRAEHLAAALWRMSAQPSLHGTLHFTDAGVASWYDVAVAVRDSLQALGRLPESARVVPIATDGMPRPARRPGCVILCKRDSWERIAWEPTDWRTGVAASTREALDA